MAGYNYSEDLTVGRIPGTPETQTEALPNLDQAPPAPGEPITIVTQLIGEPNPPGRPMVRVVHASGGQDDVEDTSPTVA